MENKEFYKVMKEMGYYIGTLKFEGKTIYPFNYVFSRLGMPEDSYLADYDQNCDYKKIYLSWYYFICDQNNMLDFDGKEMASIYSQQEEDKATELLAKNEILKKYVYRPNHSYEYLVKEHNLVKIWTN